MSRKRRHFTKDLSTAFQHMKRWSASLAVKELQIKTAVEFHHTSSRVARSTKNKAEGRQHPVLVRGCCDPTVCCWVCGHGRSVWRFLIKLSKHNTARHPTPRYFPREMKSCIRRENST